jgi:hypothetical protein
MLTLMQNHYIQSNSSRHHLLLLPKRLGHNRKRRGEAVGFPACRQAGKALECGSFRLWEIADCTKSNVFIPLARLNPNG